MRRRSNERDFFQGKYPTKLSHRYLCSCKGSEYICTRSHASHELKGGAVKSLFIMSVFPINFGPGGHTSWGQEGDL